MLNDNIKNTIIDTIIDNNKKYNGSNICILSSHLFLLASLFNYYHNNTIESISIFILYITSFIYHYNGEKTINIINNNNIKLNYKPKIIDLYCCCSISLICILLSLKNYNTTLNYNLYPTFFILFISIMYYYGIAHTNILHAILIHLPGSLACFIYNINNIFFMSKTITSQLLMIWISLIIICFFYLVYYDFYLSYKIKLLNINIKNLKIDYIKKVK